MDEYVYSQLSCNKITRNNNKWNFRERHWSNSMVWENNQILGFVFRDRKKCIICGRNRNPQSGLGRNILLHIYIHMWKIIEIIFWNIRTMPRNEEFCVFFECCVGETFKRMEAFKTEIWAPRIRPKFRSFPFQQAIPLQMAPYKLYRPIEHIPTGFMLYFLQGISCRGIL